MTTLQRPTSNLQAVLIAVLLGSWSWALGSSLAWAQPVAPVVSVVVEQEGAPVVDPLIASLIEVRAGERLSMRAVRETIDHLISLGRFEDVQVFSDPAAGGVRVRFVLFPMHPIDRIEFRGTLGLPEGDLRKAVVDRYTVRPPAGRAAEIAQSLRLLYAARGYANARVTTRVEETHAPDRATLVLDVDAGRRAVIGRVAFEQVDITDPAVFLGQPAIRTGQPYDAAAVDGELQRYEAVLRSRGYYEARATHSVEYASDGTATVFIAVDRGPLVSVAFTGDPLPEAERDRLVPVRAEASADQDLLEDAARAIADYLHARGYRNAAVDFSREEGEGELVVTFNVRRGRRHVVTAVAIGGNTAIADGELAPLLPLEPGEPFVQATLDGGVTSIRNLYRQRGFTRAMVEPEVAAVPGSDGGTNADQPVEIAVTVTEGPRTLIGEVAFDGNMVLPDAELHAMLTTAPGRPFSELEVATDRDRIDLEYRNRGYESVVVQPRAALAENDTRANVTFSITEGPQVIVDRIIISGNRRTSTATIERELLLRPGEPLGYSARLESQQRLAALGLFRRVRIEELPHAGEARRDVLVEVEEAPPTTLGYGGGVEGGTRLRIGEDGRAEERFEIAPRGFFEIGRRNMWGKNRSVNLFTRVSLRARDVLATAATPAQPAVAPESTLGFNEYRIVGQYREPRVFNTGSDLLVSGVIDQAIRSSFDFIRRQARGEMGFRLSPQYSAAGVYSFERTELFNERFNQGDDPVLIDRLFPQVRLSKLSGSVIRDTRSDVVDPQRGSLVVFTTDLAARALGSEVGFVKTYLQGFRYQRLPSARRMILALGARIGAAHGFERVVENVGTVQDLPASERFFAGGDTTVRGFSLDRLGTAETITASGFPRGGNGVLVLNGELRVGVLETVDAVGFVDAGNVYLRVGDLDVTDVRPAAGFGVHYRSPVGPIRVELGFNLDRQELVPGTLERASVLHISLGRAF